jgi:lipopolysaccharide biosynthesis regulator YciM
MELDLSWILIGLPLAFALGWVASRLDLRQMRVANRQAPRAYFKGLNYLLNEQQDKAIDAFIEAVQNDPDTSELHFALGNLFRRRGEYDRAVRVHEHLLSRADLSHSDRQRAQHGLALDFVKAGLLDRAEDALRKLEASPYEGQARLARLAIYERSREWRQAEEVARLLETSGEANFSVRLAHYRCEQAREALQSGDVGNALQLLSDTVKDHPDAPRARILLGQLQLSQGQSQASLSTLWPLFSHAHPAAGLAAQTLVKAARDANEQTRVRQVLLDCYEQQPAMDTLEALSGLDADPPGRRYLEHLRQHSSLLAASRWMNEAKPAPVPEEIRRAVEQAARPLARYRCAACGFEAREHFWHCPGCQAWDSYPPRRIEEI